MTSETEQERDLNIVFLNRVVFAALNKKVMKTIFDMDFAAWYDGGESYRLVWKTMSLSREEIARLNSAGIQVETISAYDSHHVQVEARVNRIDKVHGFINDGRKHVIPTK